MLQLLVEVRCGVREPEGFEGLLPPRGIGADQPELPQVRHEHELVAGPVAGYLLPGCYLVQLVLIRLRFHDAPFRDLSRPGPAPLQLPGGIEPDVRMSGALVGEFGDAEDLRLQAGAHGVEQVNERGVGGSLTGRAARRALPGEIAQVVLDGGRELSLAWCHRQLWWSS